MVEVNGPLAALPQALVDLESEDPEPALAAAVVVSSVRRDWREQADDATRALLSIMGSSDLEFDTKSQCWRTLLLLTKAGVPGSAPSTRQAVAQLAERTMRDEWERDELRCEAVGVLGLLWPDVPATPEALNVLAAGLTSGDAAVQLAAATAVGQFKRRGTEHLEKHAFRIATTYLCDEDPERRIAALVALTSLGQVSGVTKTVRGGYDIVPSVEALLCDDDLEVQIVAARCLADLESPSLEALELMFCHVDNPTAYVRLASATSWGRLGCLLDRSCSDEEAVDFLTRSTVDQVVNSDPHLSMLAVQALAWLSVARPDVSAGCLPSALRELENVGKRGSSMPVGVRLLSFRAWAELYSCLEAPSKRAAEIAANNLGGDDEETDLIEENSSSGVADIDDNNSNNHNNVVDGASGGRHTPNMSGAREQQGGRASPSKSTMSNRSNRSNNNNINNNNNNSNNNNNNNNEDDNSNQRLTPSLYAEPSVRANSRASSALDRSSVKTAKSTKSTKSVAGGAADAGQVLAALGPDVQGQDQQVFEQLSHPRAEVRNAAGRALAEMGEHGIGQLALALKHPDWKVRIAAANALRDKGFEDAHRFVPHVAND